MDKQQKARKCERGKHREVYIYNIHESYAAERSSRGKHRAVICIHTVSIIHTDVGPRAVVIVLSADGEVVEGEFYDVAVENSDVPHTVRIAGVLQWVVRRRERTLVRRQRL